MLRYTRGSSNSPPCNDVEVVTIRLPRGIIDRVARERTGTRAAVRFAGMRPVFDATARGWRKLTSFVQREITAEASPLESPLINAQMCELIAATALVTFPNSAMQTEGAPVRSYARPATVRRAIAFIEANAAEPISISQIAAAANVTPRALQYGFARHCDTTPSAYLRRVRLARAHRDLQSAGATMGATVADIAARWGFGNTARFAGSYRMQYGGAAQPHPRT